MRIFDLYASHKDLKELGLALPSGRQLVINSFPYKTEDRDEIWALENHPAVKSGKEVAAEAPSAEAAN